MLAAMVLESAEMLSKIVGSSFVLKEIYSIWKNEQEIRMLADTVDYIRDVLSHLQGLPTLDANHINCCNRLREVFLEAEDFLDRVQTIHKKKDYEARMIKQAKAEIRLKSKGKLSLRYARLKIKPLENKVRRFFSCSNQAKHAVKVHNKIKEISMQFEAIKNFKSFNVTGNEPISTSEETLIDARARGSKVDATRLIGRGEDKRKIVDLLLRSCVDERKIPVISVVGIGGMGKTTVAQLVYGDQDWQDRFAMKLWVSDSKKYKLKPLLKHMLKSIDHNAAHVDSLEEDQLRDLFVDKIGGKSFFLALDDVDNENHWSWEQLELLLNHGNRVESRILVTTRSREVAEVVRSDDLIHELEGLSDKHSLELFERFAFQERRDGISDELVKQIVKKCCGVPLALKVIGTFLRGKNSDKWEMVRDSNSLANVGERNDLIPVLKISYNDLDPTVQQCFSLCAIFPKNSLMPVDLLRDTWAANIHFKTTEGETPEDACDKSSRILYNRCFLETITQYVFDGTLDARGYKAFSGTYFKMHDLMYDLAKEVAGAETLILDSNLKVKIAEEKVRHLFLTDGTPNIQLKGKRLRSIIRSKGANIQNILKPSYASDYPFLRVLDLSNCGIQNLTDSVGKLICLRCLYLAGNKFRTLPKSITKLINLRHLDLESCESLTHLPSGMDALISLQVLNLAYCENLEELPTGIEKITDLKKVLFSRLPRVSAMPAGMGALLPVCPDAIFIVGHPGSSSHAQLEELEPLSDLPERLTIKLPKNITSKAAAQDGKAFLLNKKRLRSLKIEWEHNPRLEEEVPANHEDILAKLQPSPNLEAFSLDGYQGMTFPPWATDGFDSILPNLENLYISNCRRCRYLPSLNGLEYLTYLRLSDLSSLEYIEENISAAPFCLPNLEFLKLCDLPELKGWCRASAAGVNDNDSEDTRLMLMPSFPRLTEVGLVGCPNFTDPSVLLSLNKPSLSFKFFSENGKLSSSREKNDSWTMTFSGMKTEVAPRYMAEIFRAVSDHLTGLCIEECYWLKTADHPDVPWSCLTNLQELVLSDLPNMVRLPEGLQFLTSLEKIRINSCENLLIHHPHMPWSCLTSLQELVLRDLPKMVSLPEGIQFLTSLQKIHIDSCANLLIPDWLQKTFECKVVDESSELSGIEWSKKGMDACSTSTTTSI